MSDGQASKRLRGNSSRSLSPGDGARLDLICAVFAIKRFQLLQIRLQFEVPEMPTWHFTGQLAIRPATVRISQAHAIRIGSTCRENPPDSPVLPIRRGAMLIV
ncbi:MULTISPECIES: hypothetical protein [unclassified Mesorhizobium]|uniref:hypothetical protein n=1 Tax=unclassified Mesorhizobium TaxID=325217 RepID=UPI000FD43873|nr:MULTISPECIES: hypothetical protein [unclassified Mesorhizobium]RUZ98003.1 hypothetical protein EN938_32915 [Mesorhizobium sp. M7A.F.Ca.US.001.02.1.1]RVA08660.1 hypothetical protein EN932_25145 [Mesorhizobium sp. M7A.F.Ca.US.002.01.1.1]